MVDTRSCALLASDELCLHMYLKHPNNFPACKEPNTCLACCHQAATRCCLEENIFSHRLTAHVEELGTRSIPGANDNFGDKKRDDVVSDDDSKNQLPAPRVILNEQTYPHEAQSTSIMHLRQPEVPAHSVHESVYKLLSAAVDTSLKYVGPGSGCGLRLHGCNDGEDIGGVSIASNDFASASAHTTGGSAARSQVSVSTRWPLRGARGAITDRRDRKRGKTRIATIGARRSRSGRGCQPFTPSSGARHH